MIRPPKTQYDRLANAFELLELLAVYDVEVRIYGQNIAFHGNPGQLIRTKEWQREVLQFYGDVIIEIFAHGGH